MRASPTFSAEQSVLAGRENKGSIEKGAFLDYTLWREIVTGGTGQTSISERVDIDRLLRALLFRVRVAPLCILA